MEPFVDLGIDLDLLRGYETLAVAVGEGNRTTSATPSLRAKSTTTRSSRRTR